MQIFGCTGAGTPNPCAIQESTASPPLNVNSFRTEQAHIGFNLVTVVPSGDPGAQRSSVLFFEGKNRVNKACLGVSEGEMLGPALAENTGLTELNINWNHLRGPGAVAFARALEANIFLRVLDISYNGFGDPGASAVGEALKTNNVLEELNMSNNRISAVGALSLGLGLRVNQTLRILVMSRNPMRGEGCFGVLKSVRDNPESALELLDFSFLQLQSQRVACLDHVPLALRIPVSTGFHH
uniref:Leucine rich repeat containing 74B n=1 Tax=Felis catus TaxID=9685 RepID=A0ABI7VQ12_FELCA